MRRLTTTILSVFLWITWAGLGAAAEPNITLTIGDRTSTYSADQLLKRPDAVEITVARDPVFGRPMNYRAVPLWALLDAQGMQAADVLEVTALDGFVAQLPGTLVTNREPAEAIAMLAVEDPAKPWPPLPGKKVSAGPFYVVWVGQGVKSILDEQWPYQVAAMREAESVEKRWPQLAVEPSLPPNDPLRQGLEKFVGNCGVCHKLAGGGAAEVGPDLNRPMSPTEYFAPEVLRKFIRDPASLRDWPDRKMQGFAPSALSDDDVDLIIKYLAYKAETRQK